MNKYRRITLEKALSSLEQAIDFAKDVRSEERDAMYNMPENLQNSERYEEMENTVDYLDDAVSSMDDARRSLAQITA